MKLHNTKSKVKFPGLVEDHSSLATILSKTSVLGLIQ
jgi:hypothetical protein